MPKINTARKTSRVAPYPIATTSTMSAQVAHNYQLSAHTPTEWPSSYQSYYAPHNLMATNPVMNPLPPSAHNLPQQQTSPQPAQNGPWTSEEDDVLCTFRSQGFGWGQIQERHFPTKSANACRKRHERLMTKRRSTEWDEVRLDSLAVQYHKMRAQIWSGLAKELGEKWEHVEKAVSLSMFESSSRYADSSGSTTRAESP